MVKISSESQFNHIIFCFLNLVLHKYFWFVGIQDSEKGDRCIDFNNDVHFFYYYYFWGNQIALIFNFRMVSGNGGVNFFFHTKQTTLE